MINLAMLLAGVLLLLGIASSRPSADPAPAQPGAYTARAACSRS
jgi:hypothetical protein